MKEAEARGAMAAPGDRPSPAVRDDYAVMGHPVGHSQSPHIHTLFARQTDQAIRYRAIEVSPGRFEQAVREFRRAGGKGLSVTVPFKSEAYRLAQSPGPQARRAGAANTLWFGPDGCCYADNTDGTGLLRDLRDNLGLCIAGARVLVLGAGGAVRGVLGPLLDERPARVVIANRTLERARGLATAFAAQGDVEAVGYPELQGRQFELVVNGTSLSLQGRLPPLADGLLAPGGACYDLAYGDQPTPFMRWAERQGAGVNEDGLGMLIEQAAEAFLLWRGVRPDTRPVAEALRRGRERRMRGDRATAPAGGPPDRATRGRNADKRPTER